MAPRPAWKGYIKLSLVTCGVELIAATTNSERISFRTLNKATGNRVRRQYIDGETGEPVDKDEEVRGYELADDEFVLVEEEEIETVQIESSHTLSLDSFVDKSEIEQIYLDSPYYVIPADEVSQEAFAVIREALAQKRMAGLARIVLWRRERPAVIEPHDSGMLLTTLRYHDTVRRPETVGDAVEKVKTDKDMLDLAASFIDRKKTRFDPSRFVNSYQAALRELVEAKQSGHKAPAAKASAEPSNVVNLFDALKKSLAMGDEGSEEPSGPAKGKSGKSDKSGKPRAGRKKQSA